MSQSPSDASLTGRIQETLDLATNEIEAIHKLIAEVPLEVMRQNGLFEQTAENVSELQERSISVVYQAVRDAGHRVLGLAEELLRPAEAGAE